MQSTVSVAALLFAMKTTFKMRQPVSVCAPALSNVVPKRHSTLRLANVNVLLPLMTAMNIKHLMKALASVSVSLVMRTCVSVTLMKLVT